MYCSNCGSQIDDASKFCPVCGAAQETAPGLVPQPAQYVPAESDQYQQQPAYGYQQPDQQYQQQPAYGYQQLDQQYQQQAPYGYQQSQYPIVPQAYDPADMPSTGAAKALIVVGFLLGILWGVIGYTQYKPMKEAIQMGDVATAKQKYRNIVIATVIGVVVNVLFVVFSLR